MIIYSTDEYGNVIKKQAQQDINGRYVYNDRKWSAEPPPLTDTTEVAVCLAGKWEKKKINAGRWYHKQTAQEKEITEYDPYFKVEEYTLSKPVKYGKYDAAKDKWVEDPDKKKAAEDAEAAAQQEALIQAELRAMAEERISQKQK